MFLEMCLVGGSEVLPQTQQVGLLKANKPMTKYQSFDEVNIANMF